MDDGDFRSNGKQTLFGRILALYMNTCTMWNTATSIKMRNQVEEMIPTKNPNLKKINKKLRAYF